MRSKKSEAWKLAKDAADGPSCIPADKRADYVLYVTTWILPQMRGLIPQLSGLVWTVKDRTDIQLYLPGYNTRPEEHHCLECNKPASSWCLINHDINPVPSYPR